MHQSLCVCGSNKPFKLCCEPLLRGAVYAKTPVKLMRSRYSAYALGGYGQYLKDTWSADVSSTLDEAELSTRSINWCGLDIISKSQTHDVAMVTFKASFIDDHGVTQVHHEASEFRRVMGRWFYQKGEIF